MHGPAIASNQRTVCERASACHVTGRGASVGGKGGEKGDRGKKRGSSPQLGGL